MNVRPSAISLHQESTRMSYISLPWTIEHLQPTLDRFYSNRRNRKPRSTTAALHFEAMYIPCSLCLRSLITSKQTRGLLNSQWRSWKPACSAATLLIDAPFNSCYSCMVSLAIWSQPRASPCRINVQGIPGQALQHCPCPPRLFPVFVGLYHWQFLAKPLALPVAYTSQEPRAQRRNTAQRCHLHALVSLPCIIGNVLPSRGLFHSHQGTRKQAPSAATLFIDDRSIHFYCCHSLMAPWITLSFHTFSPHWSWCAILGLWTINKSYSFICGSILNQS